MSTILGNPITLGGGGLELDAVDPDMLPFRQQVQRQEAHVVPGSGVLFAGVPQITA